ncbi:hypothetical protein A2U01_0078139, partial [Trifolium medium]|nr:hypothetical protein [Trifolium medium]
MRFKRVGSKDTGEERSDNRTVGQGKRWCGGRAQRTTTPLCYITKKQGLDLTGVLKAV